MQKIKKILFAAVMCLLPLQAMAQVGTMQKPETTSPAYIAMLFYKMVGGQPDFSVWAQDTRAYKEAGPEYKFSVQEVKAAELGAAYNLLNAEEPILVNIPVRIPAYSTANQGYFIKEFSEDAFFGFSHLGVHYAIVPKDIFEQQWISAAENEALAIEQALGPYREGIFQITLTPRYADAEKPLSLDGQENWLILAEIDHIALWNHDSSQILWETGGTKMGDETKEKLLDLYR